MDSTNRKRNDGNANYRDGPPKKKQKKNAWMTPKPGLRKQARSDGKIEVEDEEVRFLTRANWPVIKTQKRKFATKTIYNFRSVSISPKTIIKKLRKVYDDQASYNGSGSVFKANIRVGMILMDRVTTQLFFYQPEGNTMTLNDGPLIIQTKKDIEVAEEQFNGQDFHEKLVNYAATNSRFVFFRPTNIQIEVIPLEDFPLRGDLEPSDFPSSLTKQRDVYCFIKSSNGKNLLHDNLCLFRCLSTFFMKKMSQNCEKDARKLLKQYCVERGMMLATFPGVTIGELELVENCIDVGLKVYGNNGVINKAKFLCRLPQEGKKNGICHLFRFKNKHFCLIKPEHEESFLGGFRCSKCAKFSRTKRDCNWHEKNCKGASAIVVKSGKFQARENLVEKLWKVFIPPIYDFHVFQPYFVVFDAESSMEKPTDEMTAAKTTYDYKHKAIVVCAATNLPGETVKLFINEEDGDGSDKYLRDFLGQVEKWRRMMKKINLHRVQYIIDDLDRKISTVEKNPNDFCYLRRLERLRAELFQHLSTINLISFNGRSYDIPLMRNHLLPLIHQFGNDMNLMTEDDGTSLDDNDDDDDDETDESKTSNKIERKKRSGIHFLLKQGASRYDAVMGNSIRLLDVLNYLGGQAVTLRSFVSNFAKDQKEKVDKAWFPYKFLKEIERASDLKQFGLPEITDFTSDMGEGNTLGKNDIEIEANYEEFVKLWKDTNCSTLYDWLLEYVKIDCLCMIPAVESLQEEWHEKEIDLFSSHCTIQSALLPYLFKTAPKNTYFVVPDENIIKFLREKGIVGGLAEIFTRHQEADVTPVSQGSTIKTKLIESLDSNSQYLAALASEMPVGPYLVRKRDEQFKPVLSGEKRATSAIQWLDYEAQKNGYGIRHTLYEDERTFYHGRQMRPDGYCEETDTIYEFDGCDTHGCNRSSCKKSKLGEEISPVTRKTYNEMRKNTITRNDIWKSHHNNFIIKQECEFDEELKNNGELKDFVKRWMLGPHRFGSNTTKLTEDSMIDKLISGQIFGFALVDVECDSKHPNYEKLKMFPPIIRHININRKMIPKEVLQIGEQNGINFVKPRKNLVACMTGKEVLMYTPLLKYLCEIGVTIKKVHQVIQFQGNHFPFREYESIVADMRREGDRTNNSVKTNMAKHMGASAWGKFAFNPHKRKSYKITNSAGFKKYVNGPSYLSHLELDGGYSEVQLKPKIYKYDMPIQIAVAVFGAAKLNLLRFVHSYVLKYFDYKKLAICGSDTDSVIVSWGSENPESLVLPHLREEYEKVKYEFIVDERTPETEAYTKRQPGLFKVEKQAKGFIGLSAKCYILADEFGNTLKHAAKGVSAKTNKEILRFNTFKDALYTGVAVQATNISFRTVKNKTSIYTTKSTRTGLQPFYVKRKLLGPDLIFSEPLDETLEDVD